MIRKTRTPWPTGLLVWVGALMLLVGGGWCAFHAYAYHSGRQALQRARALGWDVHPQHLVCTDPAVNGWFALVETATDLIVRLAGAGIEYWPSKDKASPEWMTRARQFRAEHGPCFDRLAAALARPELVSRIDDPYGGSPLLFSDFRAPVHVLEWDLHEALAHDDSTAFAIRAQRLVRLRQVRFLDPLGLPLL